MAPKGTTRANASDAASGQSAPDVFDVHAHYFPNSLPNTFSAASPRLVTDGDSDRGNIMLGDAVFRAVRAPLWDLDARLAAMDTAGVRRQLVSPVPIMLTYADDPVASEAFARAVNDSLASHVAASGGRLSGLGTVTLQDPARAVTELERVMGELRLTGVEIGSQVDGTDLDDPALRPFFEAAQALDAAIFVHPLDGGGRAIRRSGEPFDFGLGMLTDTAIAATSLVFGGVLDQFPALRICLAHGCGTFAWAYPRLRLAGQAMMNVPGAHADELVRSLWADTLVFDPAHLGLLARRFGPDHVVVGTDYPFIPGQLGGARDLLAAAVDEGAVTADQVSAILADNARAFVDGTTPTASDKTPAGTAPHR